MPEATKTQWDANGNLEVLTFDLHEETFALEATLVREILDLLPETLVPGAAPLVGSVVNFRGKIIPIADLRLAFGLTAADPTVDSRIIVIELETENGGILLGIRTDKVHEVATLHEDSSEQPPAVGMRWRREYVRDLVRTPEGVIVLPDLSTIFRPFLGGGEAAAASTVH